MVESKKIVQSTKWSAISEFLVKLASPIANIILARLLAPEVFGLVATFTLVTTFAELFTDAGFQKYIVQHEFDDQRQLYEYTNVAFWSNMIFSMVLWLGIVVFRNPIADFVGSSGHGIEIAVLSFLIPVHALSSIQNALFKREFKFKELVPIRFLASLVPLVVTIPCALFLKNAWAIIIGNLTKELLTALLLTVKSDWKPKLFYKIAYLKDMLSDCLWLLGDSIMIWITSYASTFVVNRFLDEYYTGLYQTGISTITPYISLIFMITSPVLFSTLSRLQNEPRKRDEIFLNYQKYVSYLVIPIGVCIFIYRELVTKLLLGDAWMDAALLIGCTGLSLPICIITAQYNSVYFRAAGCANVAMIVQGTYGVVMIAFLLYGVNQSFEILSVIGGSLNFVYCAISILALSLVFKVRFCKTIINVFPALLAAGITGLVAFLLKDLFGGELWWQIITLIIDGFIYIVLLMMIPASREAIVNTSQFKLVKEKVVRKK